MRLGNPIIKKDYVVVGRFQTIKSIILRIIAVFTVSGLSVLGAGSVVGIDILSAILIAGILGVATVIEKLARGFLNDGKLVPEEIEEAFSSNNS